MDTPIPRISHLEPPEQAARRLKVVLDALEAEWGLTPADAILEYQRWQYDEVVAADEARDSEPEERRVVDRDRRQTLHEAPRTVALVKKVLLPGRGKEAGG